jgi:hypothetical protein
MIGILAADRPGDLGGDFARFRFFLGATVGEGVFTPDEP